MKKYSSATIWIIGLLLFFAVATFMLDGSSVSNRMVYSDFQQKWINNQVESINVNADKMTIEVTTQDEKKYTVYAPSSMIEFLNEQYPKDDIKIEYVAPSNSSIWVSLLPTIMIIILFVVFIFFFTQQSQGGGSSGRGVMNFGKSKAKMVIPDSKRVTFDDVAGADEEKAELEEIVDFLKQPERYVEMGARIPKGVLLVGPPGTGKTLLAKAIAGEAGVPFFSISGSDFVEMFVGVGASRVRDLFNNAKKNAPSIIFIDEIDAIGRRRGNGTGGGNDEREQTLNQLLVEMDGFEGDEGVIVIAATNRSDVLDPALLRPGRFDRKVLVGRPDVRGREAILKVHAKNKPLAPDVDLKEIARQTPGFVGADLANVLNEAALVAARRNGTEITASDIDEAEDRVIAGPAKKDRLIAEPERRRVAFHEAGHSICGLVLSDSRTVRKVTIVPRGRAGGYNIMLPKDDQFILTKKQLFEQIVGLMGGRAGEEATIGDKSTGASNDFEQATAIAHSMVVNYGMTDSLGMVELEKEGETNPYGFKPYSEATSAKIDEAVKKILDEAHAKALEIVKENKEKHRIIAESLLKYETLDEKQIMSLYKTGKMPEKYESEYPSESKASTYEEAKAAAEKREVEKAEKKDSDQALADQEKDALETPSEKNHEVEEHNAENPEKNQNTDSTKTDSPAEDDEHKDN